MMKYLLNQQAKVIIRKFCTNTWLQKKFQNLETMIFSTIFCLTNIDNLIMTRKKYLLYVITNDW